MRTSKSMWTWRAPRLPLSSSGTFRVDLNLLSAKPNLGDHHNQEKERRFMKNQILRLSILAGLSIICISSTVAQPLYSTSFEDLPTGMLKTASETGATWKSLGKSEITTAYHKTGSQCLRMFGGTDNTLAIAVRGARQNRRG